MTQIKIAQQSVEMAKVPADLNQVAGILRQKNVTGPMRDYAEKRLAGLDIPPTLASAAHAQAKKLVDDAKLAGLTDTAADVSVGILEALLNDIASFARYASSRNAINKLANKFEKAFK